MSITNWYVNGTGGVVTVGASLQFSNGQTAPFAAKGNFTIYRPTLSGFSTVNPGYTNSSRSFLFDGTILSYGDAQGDHGLYWSIDLSSKYNGRLGILQLVNAVYTQNYGWCPDCRDNLNTGGTFWLDGSPTSTYHDPNNYTEQVYLTDQPVTYSINFDDQPAGELWVLPGSPINIRLWGQFQDYIRFQPSGTNSIFVTLGTNGWSMEGEATVTSGIVTNYTPAPSNPSASDQFPVWTSVKGSK
jgi:hypothetical protein